MEPEILATRRFALGDHLAFAELSGDRNPMHMDPVAARRTQVGAPVIHGVHAALAVFETISQRFPDLPAIATLRVLFDKPIYVGDTATIILLRHDRSGIRAEIRIEGMLAQRFAIGFSGPADAPPRSDEALIRPAEPIELAFGDMAEYHAKVAFWAPASAAACAFPAAAGAWGAQRIGALACLSYIVGMVCPGLHSVFGGLAVSAVPESDETVDFHVTVTDPRFRSVRADVNGGGLAGTIESAARVPPVLQASMADVAATVVPNEFAGAIALVVGGSRGLGELAAKAIAAGGGTVTITYYSGSSDAQGVADEIRAAGGACDIIRFDVRSSAALQLASLSAAPNQLYYMATPQISRRKAGLFTPDRLREFLDYYAVAFWDTLSFLHSQNASLSVLYPSSVFVEIRPTDLVEYAMAKSAGEILCATMQAALPSLHIAVERLPRLATDQTAGLRQTTMPAALATVLPAIRKVHAASRSRDIPK